MPLNDAVAKSLEKFIRSTEEYADNDPGDTEPPNHQPKLEFPVADASFLPVFVVPLGDDVTESLEKSIRSIVVIAVLPPLRVRLPNQHS